MILNQGKTNTPDLETAQNKTQDNTENKKTVDEKKVKPAEPAPAPAASIQTSQGYQIGFGSTPPVSPDSKKQAASQNAKRTTVWSTFLQCILLTVLVLGIMSVSFNYPLQAESPSVINTTMLSTYGSDFKSLASFLAPDSVTKFSLFLTSAIFGTSPFAFRVCNLCLHLLTVFLLLFFIKQLLIIIYKDEEDPVPYSKISWATFCAVAFFALHPILPYTATYIIQRSFLLGTLFSILTLALAYQGIAKSKVLWMLLSALCYFAAVHATDRAIFLPFFVLFFSVLVNPVSAKNLSSHVLQFILYLPSALHLLYQKSDVLGFWYEKFLSNVVTAINAHITNPIATATDFSLSQYHFSILEQIALFFKYLFLALIPLPQLMAIHIPSILPVSFVSWPQTPAVVLFVLFAVAALYLWSRKGSKGLFGLALLFPFILFLSELLITQTEEAFQLQRLYLWLPGLVLLLTLALMKIPYKIKWVLAGFYIVTLMFVLHNRLITFSSPIVLWDDACQKITTSDYASPSAHKPFFYMGIELASQGHYKEAIPFFQRAVDIEPKLTPGYYNLGAAFSNIGEYTNAISSFLQASALSPNNYLIPYNLGNAYLSLGNPKVALSFYERSIQLNSIHMESHLAMAIALLQSEQVDAAIEKFIQVIQVNPKLSKAFTYLGNAYLQKADYQKATSTFEKLLALNPLNPHALLGLAKAAYYSKKTDEAKDYLEKALNLDPNLSEAKELLEKINLEQINIEQNKGKK